MKKYFTTVSLIAVTCIFSISGYSQVSNQSDIMPIEFIGKTDTVYVYSPGLEGNLLGDPSTQPVKVYLPPGYDQYPKNRYPVLYLLHGYTEDYDTYYYKRGLLEKLNYLMANRTISPMIVVTPNGKNAYDGCLYANSYVTGNWEDYIVQNVVQHIDSKFLALEKRDSRGLSGYSMGGNGTISIAMKHPSLYSSIVMIGAGRLDFELSFNQGDPPRKEHVIAAAKIGEYRPADDWRIRGAFAKGAALSPDSSVKPILCRLPYNAEGERIDSIWQKWMKFDPLTLLPAFKDSLLKLNSIQMYIGNGDPGLNVNESYHQALLDQGIEHGYEIFSAGHTPTPVLNEMLIHFSDNLSGIVPSVHIPDKQYQLKTDIMEFETDRDGKLYIVPKTVGQSLSSILNSNVHTADMLANEKYNYPLSDLDFGRYMVYAVCNDSVVSNIPGEFCVVPDTTSPNLSLTDEVISQGDEIRLSSNRDGSICLLSCGFLGCISLNTIPELLDPPTSVSLIDTFPVQSDQEISISTDKLTVGSYMIYGFDQYGILSKPYEIKITQGPTSLLSTSTPEIELFPNPVESILTVKLNRPNRYDLTISSINGQEIFSDQMEGTTHQLDLSSFRKGVYFITIYSKNFISTRKIVKR